MNSRNYLSKQKTVLKVVSSIVALSLCVATANALDPDTKDPRVIVQAANNRDDGDKRISRSIWTLTDSSGKSRKRVLRLWSIDFAEGTKTLMIYEKPADIRNTGFLSIDYTDEKKEDDQWLYLPRLHKTIRIASADRSDSFLGTDLSYYDLSRPNVNANNYKLLKASVDVNGDDCWLIEATPKTDKEKRESGYQKSHLWFSKKTLLPVQSKAWLAKGDILKYLKLADIKQVNGIWTPYRLIVQTLKNGKVESTTTVEFTSVMFNQESVKEHDFSPRRLEKGL